MTLNQFLPLLKKMHTTHSDMEQEEEIVFDKQYVKGFNQGYILAEHTPDLVKMLLKNQLPENDYVSGFKAGKSQFTLERMKAKAKGITPPDTSRKISKGMDKDI
jgi:hypothetical protein